MAHGSNNAPEGTVEGAVAAFEAATNTQLEASAVTNLRANSWVLHKWGAYQSESHAFVIWWPSLEVAVNLLEDATCSIDYIRISDEPFTEGRATHEEHVEVCTRGTLAPIVDTFWALRGGTAIMKYLASGVGGEDNSVVAPPRSTTSARERAEALFMADGRDALSTQQCLTLQGMYSSSSNDSDDEGEANSDSDGTDIGDQNDVAVQAVVTAPQQDTGGLNAWLRDGETARASSATRQAHPGGRVSSNKAEALAKFALRKPDRVTSLVVEAPKVTNTAEVFHILTQAEFDSMIPPTEHQQAGAYGVETNTEMHCDILGAILFVEGDTAAVDTALAHYDFVWNGAVGQGRWEAPWTFERAELLVALNGGSISITFSAAVCARFRDRL
jgi:hypothetical protein